MTVNHHVPKPDADTLAAPRSAADALEALKELLEANHRPLRLTPHPQIAPSDRGSPCGSVSIVPPYLSGSPREPTATMRPDPSGDYLVGYSAAHAQNGRIELASQLDGDDPAAERFLSDTGVGIEELLYRYESGQLMVATHRVPPTPTIRELDVVAKVRVRGTSAILARGQEAIRNPTGIAVSQLFLIIRLHSESAQKVGMEPVVFSTLLRVGDWRDISGVTPPTISLDDIVELRAPVFPVIPGEDVEIHITAEVFTAVTSDSNHVVISTFSQYSTLWQNGGGIDVSDVGIAYRCGPIVRT